MSSIPLPVCDVLAQFEGTIERLLAIDGKKIVQVTPEGLQRADLGRIPGAKGSCCGANTWRLPSPAFQPAMSRDPDKQPFRISFFDVLAILAVAGAVGVVARAVAW